VGRRVAQNMIATLIATCSIMNPQIPPVRIDIRAPKAVAVAAAIESTSPFSQLADWQREHYYSAAAAQMCAVRVVSDVFAQCYSTYHGVPLRYMTAVVAECHSAGCGSFVFDSTHTFAMGAVGLTTSGIGGAAWLRYLEAHLGPTRGSKKLAVQKATADFLLYAPLVNAANLALVPLLCGHALEASLANVTMHIAALMKLELLLFGPFNLILFSRDDLLPPELRPAFKAILSFVFSAGLSIACA
jgi:hypothetical protein